MVKQTFAFIAAVLVAAQAYAAPTVRTMYTTALAREEALRPKLASASASAATLRDARAVVSAYEAVVRRYPASSYSDNALWQAGRLALDAFGRFGQIQDRDLGVRLLRRLAESYPSSKLARQVSSQISRVDAVPPASPSAAARASAERARAAREPNDRAADEHPAATVSTAGVAPGRSRLATVRDIRRVVLPDAVRITIDLDVEVPFHDERIPDPARVFLDLPSTRAAPSLVDHTMRFDGDMDVVRQIRIGRHSNNTTRIVLDAAGVSSYSVYPLYGPYRLVIDCLRTKPAAPLTRPALALLGASVSLLPARGVAADWERRLPSAFPLRRSALIRDALLDGAATVVGANSPAASAPIAAEPLPVPSSAPPAANPPAPAPKSLPGGFSMARQLGLGVSRIVIDPGHGGHDPGAQGKGVNEAELVLDVALRLEKLLSAVPGVEVILTRRTDEFVPLPERTAIANREGADLFLSIHANASTSAQARGIETYFLNFASNLSAASVAARENAASGQAMGALPDIVKAIALNNKLDESRDFAAQVQHAMMDKLRGQNKTVRDLGVKQAPFVVLIGAAMPSVLAEISFVTNPQEARLLKSGAYRQKIAEALYGAVRKYQTSLKSAMSVAQQ
jgi:N-acetylmuramoyl-L-alanine amidase